MNQSSDNHNVITPGTIEPVRFVPSDTATQQSRWRPWHALALAGVIAVAFVFWFLFTSKSVQLTFSPLVDDVRIEGGVSFELGGVWLLREGVYTVHASADLYEPLSTPIQVGGERNQKFELALTPLPGFLDIQTDPADARVSVDGVERDANTELELPAGEHELTVSHPRYLPVSQIVTVEGRQQRQSIDVTLAPNWANVAVTSAPAGANVFIDDERWPTTTPTTIEALAGEREIRISLPGHRAYRQRIFAQAGETRTLPPVTLTQADASLQVTSSPAGAGVIVGGEFVGRTPVSLELKSGKTHKVRVVKSGYAAHTENAALRSGEDREIHARLARLQGDVVVVAEPAAAVLTVNGRGVGAANQTLTLPVESHEIRISLEGYAPYQQTVTPRAGLTQELRVRLLTLEEARLAAMKPSISTPLDQTLLLFEPYPFEMGASRREPGRRANEALRAVNMKRLFYLGTHEVTNAQFRQFASGHDSGKFVETSLNEDDQPAVNLSWHDAAAFCNWLSDKEGLPPFYEVEFGKVTRVYPNATGYRLPTEAEWSWAARSLAPEQPLLRFPWGSNLPPPDRHGNYADRAGRPLVGRVIFGYNDNYSAAAPVGMFKANHRRLHDMGGNVAEWTHDFYALNNPADQTDPLGPQDGEYHVIKGSSWMHGTITELRYSFRDYGIDGRADVGFRLARYAE